VKAVSNRVNFVPPVPHCQVPCGIYGDSMRIDMLMEDATTIEKAMKTIAEMETGREFPHNQMVRWVIAKDDHAAKIQEQVASYWLAQRIKVPAEGADDAAKKKYHQQLALLHGITVAAMKCKQTTDLAWPAKLIALPDDHIITMIVVIGKATKAAWARPGQLPVDDIVVTDRFSDSELA
jgi:nickel superoxide dismutase